MTDEQITVDGIMSWGPCEDWPRERVESVFRGQASLTPRQFARLRSVPVRDRIWALLRPAVLGDEYPRVISEIVDPVVRKYCLHCGVPRVEQWAARWLDGSDRTSQSAQAAAWDAWAAARDAWAAARAAAWAAARAAEAAATWSARAAWAAAEAAAWAAARATRAAEQKRQLCIIRRALKRLEKAK